MRSILLTFVLFSSLIAQWPTVTAHQSSSTRKIASFGAVECDDAMARLDAVAQQLQSEPEAFAYIVVYPQRNGLPGKYESYVEFTREHLKMVRGIPADHLITIRGEYRSDLTTEFWMGPRNAPPPVTTSAAGESTFGKFDEGFADYGTWEGKPALWTYDLCPLRAVYFGAFARQLRSQPGSIGRLIVHLEHGKRSSRASIMAQLLRTEMVKAQGIDSNRIVVVYGARRRIPAVELWIARQ